MPFTQTELESILAERRPEGPTLEFKRGDSLNRGDSRNRTELVKDVAGFANGEGGTIIYGISEVIDSGSPVAGAVAPVTDAGATPEWIADVVRSNTAPPLTRLEISQLSVNGGRVIAVRVEPSLTAHQSSLDYRYYQRGSMGTAPMTDSQVRDVMSRRNRPDARVVLSFPRLHQDANLHRYMLQVMIENVGNVSIHNWWLDVFMPADCVRDSRPGDLMHSEPRFYQIVRERPFFSVASCGDPGVVTGRRLIIHPGQTLLFDNSHSDFCSVILEVDQRTFSAFHGRSDIGAIEARFFCEGTPPKVQTLPFDSWSRF